MLVEAKVLPFHAYSLVLKRCFGPQTEPAPDVPAHPYPRIPKLQKLAHMPNPPRPTKPKHKCRLRSAGIAPLQEQVSAKLLSLTCSVCDRFFDESGYNKSDIAGYKKKQVKKFAAVRPARDEGQESDDGNGARQIERQSIDEEWEPTSTSHESFDFTSLASSPSTSMHAGRVPRTCRRHTH